MTAKGRRKLDKGEMRKGKGRSSRTEQVQNPSNFRQKFLKKVLTNGNPFDTIYIVSEGRDPSPAGKYGRTEEEVPRETGKNPLLMKSRNRTESCYAVYKCAPATTTCEEAQAGLQ